MEQFPTNNEQGRARPMLHFDADGETGNIFSIISRARGLLEGENRDNFMAAICEATAPGAEKNYEDMLALINEHVSLVDTSPSQRYPHYALLDGQGRVDGTISSNDSIS